MNLITRLQKPKNICAVGGILLFATGCSTQKQYADDTRYWHGSEPGHSTKSEKHAHVATRRVKADESSETPAPKKRKKAAPADTIDPANVGKTVNKKPPTETKVNLEGDDVKLEGNKQ